MYLEYVGFSLVQFYRGLHTCPASPLLTASQAIWHCPSMHRVWKEIFYKMFLHNKAFSSADKEFVSSYCSQTNRKVNFEQPGKSHH